VIQRVHSVAALQTLSGPAQRPDSSFSGLEVSLLSASSRPKLEAIGNAADSHKLESGAPLPNAVTPSGGSRLSRSTGSGRHRAERALQRDSRLESKLQDVPRRAQSALARAEQLSCSFAGLFGPEVAFPQHKLEHPEAGLASTTQVNFKNTAGTPCRAPDLQEVDGSGGPHVSCCTQRPTSMMKNGSPDVHGGCHEEDEQRIDSLGADSMVGADHVGQVSGVQEDCNVGTSDVALGRYSEGRFIDYTAEVDEEMAARRAAGEASGDLAAGVKSLTTAT
jgi:hypothetical protein